MYKEDVLTLPAFSKLHLKNCKNYKKNRGINNFVLISETLKTRKNKFSESVKALFSANYLTLKTQKF